MLLWSCGQVVYSEVSECDGWTGNSVCLTDGGVHVKPLNPPVRKLSAAYGGYYFSDKTGGLAIYEGSVGEEAIIDGCEYEARDFGGVKTETCIYVADEEWKIHIRPTNVRGPTDLLFSTKDPDLIEKVSPKDFISKLRLIEPIVRSKQEEEN